MGEDNNKYDGLVGGAKFKIDTFKGGLKQMIDDENKAFRDKDFPLEWALYIVAAQVTLNQGLILFILASKAWFDWALIAWWHKLIIGFTAFLTAVSVVTLIQLGLKSRRM